MSTEPRSRILSPHEEGFTLVELAIVLVIIGLIVGGVLVGQDMIRASQIRAQITQINQLNTGVGAFRLKYDCLPGDCTNLTTLFSYTGVANGDGNGIITDSTTVTGDYTDFDHATGEIYQVFPSLGTAGMFGFVGAVTSVDAAVGAGGNFPASRIANNGIIPIAISGQNWWYLGLLASGGKTHTDTDFTTSNEFGPTLSPYQTYQIDQKIDDAMPTTGAVTARLSTVVKAAAGMYTPAASGSATECYNTAYNNTALIKDNTLCQMAFRWSH